MLRNADRVKLACLAQLVNVIAPIMTDANGIVRQTIYYPYSWALQFARGAALDLLVESSTYEVAGMDPVAYLDVAGSLDHGDGKLSLFILNRDLVKAHEVEVNSASMLTGDDLKASNTFTAPQKVVPQSFTTPEARGGRTRFEVPARSYSVIQWSL